MSFATSSLQEISLKMRFTFFTCRLDYFGLLYPNLNVKTAARFQLGLNMSPWPSNTAQIQLRPD